MDSLFLLHVGFPYLYCTQYRAEPGGDSITINFILGSAVTDNADGYDKRKNHPGIEQGGALKVRSILLEQVIDEVLKKEEK